jgi:L-threonylcarbamoyladenylate synthase
VALKGREPGRPFPVLVADRAMLEGFAVVSAEAEALMRAHWPGALTLVLPARPGLPGPLLNDAGEVGVRLSAHAAARRLVEAFAAPITATSANPSGCPAARDADEVRAALPGVAVLDDGPAGGAPPSTVVRFDGGRLVVLRQGALHVPWPR